MHSLEGWSLWWEHQLPGFWAQKQQLYQEQCDNRADEHWNCNLEFECFYKDNIFCAGEHCFLWVQAYIQHSDINHLDYVDQVADKI